MISLMHMAAGLAGLVLAGPAPPGPAPHYVRLTGAELREALVGKFVRPRSCLHAEPCGGIFSRYRNRYHLAADRVPWVTGSYILEEDRVCITMPRSETRCHFLARSDQGVDFLVSTDNAVLPLVEVQITDATGIPVPDF